MNGGIRIRSSVNYDQMKNDPCGCECNLCDCIKKHEKIQDFNRV